MNDKIFHPFSSYSRCSFSPYETPQPLSAPEDLSLCSGFSDSFYSSSPPSVSVGNIKIDKPEKKFSGFLMWDATSVLVEADVLTNLTTLLCYRLLLLHKNRLAFRDVKDQRSNFDLLHIKLWAKLCLRL